MSCCDGAYKRRMEKDKGMEMKHKHRWQFALLLEADTAWPHGEEALFVCECGADKIVKMKGAYARWIEE